MSQTIQANPRALIESIARKLHPGAQDDARQFFNLLLDNITSLSPGGNLLQAGGAPAGSSAPPTGVSHSVAGANAAYSVQIANPPNAKSTIYHELSYSPVVSFTKNVTTLPPTTNTSISIPSPGGNYFFRLRSSYDKKTWTNHQLTSPSAISAGLVESSAISSGAAFNQTNYAVVNSNTAGPAAQVNISGPSGQFTPYTAVKGTKQVLRPSATIFGSGLTASQFVGWDGDQYRLAPTLAQVLSDNLEPVGAITVGSTQTGGGGTGGGNGGRLTQDLNVVTGTIA